MEKRYAALEREFAIVKEQASRTQAALQEQVGQLQDQNTQLTWKAKDETQSVLVEEIADQRALRRAVQQERQRLEVMLSVCTVEKEAALAQVTALEVSVKTAADEAAAARTTHATALEKTRKEWEELLFKSEDELAQERAHLEQQLQAAKLAASRNLEAARMAEARSEQAERDTFAELMELQESLKNEQGLSAQLREEVQQLQLRLNSGSHQDRDLCSGMSNDFDAIDCMVNHPNGGLHSECNPRGGASESPSENCTTDQGIMRDSATRPTGVRGADAVAVLSLEETHSSSNSPQMTNMTPPCQERGGTQALMDLSEASRLAAEVEEWMLLAEERQTALQEAQLWGREQLQSKEALAEALLEARKIAEDRRIDLDTLKVSYEQLEEDYLQQVDEAERLGALRAQEQTARARGGAHAHATSAEHGVSIVGEAVAAVAEVPVEVIPENEDR